MSNRWRLIRSGAMTGAQNMALDEALLEAVAAGQSPPVLRLYRWHPAAVSLGYFQKGPGVVNLPACRQLGLDVVRRSTGGRAVLHDREVTYAIMSPERNEIFPGGLLENYRVIARVLQQAIAAFGLSAELSSGRSRAKGASAAEQSACFTAPAHHELVYRGCKLTGSAQKRSGRAFLQHGSIPVDLDLQTLYRALDCSEQSDLEAGARRLSRTVGWLNRWLPGAVTVAEVEERLVDCFAQQWQVRFEAGEPSPSERSRARCLEEERFGNPLWTLNNLTAFSLKGRDDL